MKRIITLACALVSGLLFISSCDTMETVYEQYKGDSPTQYVEKVKDVIVSPGFNKAKLSWGPLSDPRIKKVVISWANNAGSKTFDWDPSTPFEAVVEDLKEGSTIFSITTFDNSGHNSVTVDVTSTVYGDNFKNSIEESAVTNGTYNETSNEIKLALRHTSNVYYKGMVLIYTNLEGVEVRIPVEDGVESVSITDAVDLDIKYSSLFMPQEGCMEYYESPAKSYEELKTPVFHLEADKIVFAAASGCSKVISLTANRAPINVQTDAAWLSVDENSGKITVKTTAANPESSSRTAVVSVVAKDGKADITVKQTMNRIGTAYGTEGVIWWQNKDNPSEYKIISAARGNCKWATVNEDTKTSAESGKSTVNGVTKDNNEILMEKGDESKYPAVWWCHNLGPDWYLPSGTELKALIEAYNGGTYAYASLNGKKVSTLAASAQQTRQKFDDTLESIGGYRLNYAAKDANGDWIWGSQQNTTALAWAARMGVSGYGARSKQFDGKEASGPFYTRAMKVVHIEED